MTPRRTWLGSTVRLVTIVAGLVATAQNPPSAQTVFRATTDLVTVEVMVRTNGTPVAGLTAADFLLLDNGVRQSIESVSLEPVPLDVSLLLDANEDVSDDVAGMDVEMRKIAAALRPTDRVRLMTINADVRDLMPIGPASSTELPPRLIASGVSSAHDGLVAALLRRVEPNRRHLIVALTNGIDGISTVDAAAVRDVARRSPATLHVVQVDVAPDPLAPPGVFRYMSGRERLQKHRCAFAALCSPTRRFWVPYDDHEFETLREAAESTGGALHLPGVFADRSAAGIFKDVFDDYRRSYLLRYTPRDVARQGWHELTVTVPGRPGYTTHARRGYAVDGPGLPVPRPSREDAAANELAAIVASYHREPVAAFTQRLRLVPDLDRLIGQIREAGNPWPATPRREAAFVIEIASAALQSRRRDDRDAGQALLIAHEKFVRHPFAPDPFERFWLWAALAVLQGANQPDAAQALLDRALARFPGEPRFLLTRAFLADQRRPIGSVSSAHAEQVLTLYDEARARPSTRAEAAVRKSWVLIRLGRNADALEVLDTAGDRPDAMMAYLGHFFRGRALDQLGRMAPAIAAYRAALALAPGAQSPRVALMAAQLRQGDRRSAESLADEIQAAAADAWDPVWAYWLGDYRSFPEIVRRLRDQTR